MTEEYLEKLEEKRAELRTSFYGVHGGFTKSKFKMDILRSDGRRKCVKSEPIHYFIPKTKTQKEAVAERVRRAKEKIEERESIRR